MKSAVSIAVATTFYFANTLCMAASSTTASNWFKCSNEEGDTFIAWVDSSDQVTSVATVREGDALPYFLTPMLKNSEEDRRHVLQVHPGYRVRRDDTNGIVSWVMQFGVAELGCHRARDK